MKLAKWIIFIERFGIITYYEYTSADEFKKYINDNFEKLEKYSSKLSEENCSNKESVIKKIGNLVAPEMEVASLSDDLSFNDATNENIRVNSYFNQ